MEKIDDGLLELFHAFDEFVYGIGDGSHLKYEIPQWPKVRKAHRDLKRLIIRCGLYTNHPHFGERP